ATPPSAPGAGSGVARGGRWGKPRRRRVCWYRSLNPASGGGEAALPPAPTDGARGSVGLGARSGLGLDRRGGGGKRESLGLGRRGRRRDGLVLAAAVVTPRWGLALVLVALARDAGWRGFGGRR